MRIVNAWDMESRAIPVSGHADFKTALWFGGRFNQNNEGLSIVMAFPSNRKFPEHVTEASFFIGIVRHTEIVQADSYTDAFADAATHVWQQRHDSQGVLSALINSTVALVPPPKSDA